MSVDQLRKNDGGEEFGYRQTLNRTVGRFASFAAGFSYLSILTGVFGLFYFGFGFGGPAYLWSWPIVFAGQILVTLCFVELASRYPVAGSVYNWAKKLASPTTSWLAGWFQLAASIATVAAIALSFQVTLPQIWSGFQFIGDGTGQYDASINGVIIAGVLVTVTTLINAFGVRLTALINSVGVFIELAACVLLIASLAVHTIRGPAPLLDTQGLGHGHALGYFGAFLVAGIASGWVFYGFETASDLGEETKDAKRTTPRAIVRAITATFVIGALILLFAVLATPNLHDRHLGSAAGGLQYIVLLVLGGTLGKLFLVAVGISITVCVLALQANAIRVMFGIARDNNLPFSGWLARVHPKRKTPSNTTIAVGALSVALLAVMSFEPQVFIVMSSIGIVLMYLSYLMVTVPMLRHRLNGHWPLQKRSASDISMGRRRGLIVNLIAIVWGAAMLVNLVWPRNEVYNPAPPFHWYLQWSGLIIVAALVLIGALLYGLDIRHRSNVIPEHTAGPATEPPTDAVSVTQSPGTP